MLSSFVLPLHAFVSQAVMDATPSLPIAQGRHSEAETNLLGELQAKLNAALHQEREAERAMRTAADELSSCTLSVSHARAALATVELAICRSRTLLGPHRLALLQEDVLAEIVKAWAFTGEYSRTDDQLRLVYPAFAAASICRRWRRVALNDSAIWTSVALNFSTLAHADEYLELVLNRSRTLAVHVTLTAIPLTLAKDSGLSETSLVHLLSRSHCITVKFAESVTSLHEPNLVLSMSFHGSVLPYLQVAMNELKHVSIGVVPPRIGPISAGTQLLSLSPQLTSLHINRTLWPFVVPELLPNIEIFHHMGIGVLTSGELARLARAWPRLQRLLVFAVQLAQGEGPRTLSFPELRGLMCVTHQTPLPWFTVDSVPKLAAVGYTGPPTDLLAFLGTGTFTSLTTLLLQSLNVPVGTMVQVNARLLEFVSQGVLARLPNLLLLGFCMLSPTLLKQFFELWCAKPELLPQPAGLEKISFSDIAWDVPAAQAVLNFLVLRRRAAAIDGETRLRINFNEKDGPDDSAESCGFPEWLMPQLERLAGEVTYDSSAEYDEHVA